MLVLYSGVQQTYLRDAKLVLNTSYLNRSSPLSLMKSSNNNNWEPCAPGAIQVTARDSLEKRVLLKFVCGGAIIGALVAGIVVGVMWFQEEKPTVFPGLIACTTAQEYLDDYIAEKLTPEMNCRINAHLMKCEPCKLAYKELKDGAGCYPKRAKFKPCSCSGSAPTL